jgi:integrase
MPAFMARLREREGLSARALEFLVLCASRSGEVRGAVWSEIDLTNQVWIIPAERMKAKREHRVPLTARAVELLKALPRIEGVDLVFPAPRGGPLSDMTLTALMRRMEVDAVPHGFRSSFRDWAGECTNYPRDLAEQALAHTLESKVEAAYRRGDALEKRRAMMKEWATFLEPEKKPATLLPSTLLSSKKDFA